MRIFRGGDATQQATEISTDTARHVSNNGLGATLLSGVAVLFSGYSLWDTSLKSSDISIYVPRVISYAAPYTNNFEVVSMPVTLVNQGAQTGTVMHMDLAVTDPATNETKHFYAAELGVWSMERTRTRSYEGFAPLSLAGRSSHTESVLFYTRGEDERPNQIIRKVGPYKFTLTITQAESKGGLNALLGLNKKAEPVSVTFERVLPFYDARAFENGTISMHAKDWTSSSSDAR